MKEGCDVIKVIDEHLKICAFATTGTTCNHSCEFIHVRARCVRKRARNENTKHQMIGYLAGYVNECVNMDACGSFVTTPLKNKYLLGIC